MPHLLAVANPKGGVGKTTTSIHLASTLASLGHSVLLVDLAPQGNATSGLGVDRETAELGTAEVMLGLSDLARAVRRTPCPGLDLLPATRALVGVEVELASFHNRELRLRDAMMRGATAYDHVIVDCPPSLSLLTVNALAAASGVLIPLAGEFYAMEGLCDALRTVSAMRRGLNRRLERVGVLLTGIDKRSRIHAEIANQARDVFGHEVFETEIPRDVRLVEASSFGLPVGMHDPDARAFEAYTAFTHEFLARVQPPAWANLAQEAS